MLPTTTLKYIFHRTVNLRAIKHERRERDTRYDKAKDLTTYRYIYTHTHISIDIKMFSSFSTTCSSTNSFCSSSFSERSSFARSKNKTNPRSIVSSSSVQRGEESEASTSESLRPRKKNEKTRNVVGMTALAACAICAFCDQNPAAAFDAIDAANIDVFAVGFPSDTSLLGHHEEREAFSQIAMAGEDIPFWANMAKYARFSISIMVGFVYMFARPVAKLMKDPKTAALVVLVAIAGVQFFKFTLTEMLAMNDPESFL